MFENDMMPYLASLSAQMLVSETVKIAGRGESWVAAEISDLIDKQTNPTIAPYAKTGEVHLRVTAEAEDEASAKKLLKPVVKELKKRFPKDVYTTDEHVQLEAPSGSAAEGASFKHHYSRVLHRRTCSRKDCQCARCFRSFKSGHCDLCQ